MVALGEWDYWQPDPTPDCGLQHPTSRIGYLLRWTIRKRLLGGYPHQGDFVPEQHTDYIFTTLGEEWGFYGTTTVTLLFAILCLRIWYLAENQRCKFYRIYGYCVAAIFFIHFFINISMVIGIMPTIGIPLPFFSYGGSGLWGFTMLLFIFLRLNMNKEKHWAMINV